MRLGILLVALALLIATTASANGLFFLQDDFDQAFVNGIGQAGMVVTGSGWVKDWSTGVNLYYFTLNATNSSAGYVVGSEFRTDYDQATMTWYAPGTADVVNSMDGWFYTKVKLTGNGPQWPDYYDATVYDGPGYTGLGEGSSPVRPYAENFRSVGGGHFGDFSLEWLGTYNWGYYTDGQGILHQTGNIQAKVVPEPMSVMLGVLGLSSVAGLRRLRRK